jgi:chromosome partitioning protein
MLTLICSQKGGVGKSTICINLASILAIKNKDVLIVDADKQNSVSKWAAERKISYPENPNVPCVQMYGDIELDLRNLSKKYNHILVDVSGRDSEEMRSAMMCADTVLMPFKPSQPDLATLPTMCKIIQFSRRYNRDMRVCALISIAPTNPVIKDVQQAKECISEYDDIVTLNTVLFDRTIYRDSFADGLSVAESTGRAKSEESARLEVLSLVNEVFNNG